MMIFGGKRTVVPDPKRGARNIMYIADLVFNSGIIVSNGLWYLIELRIVSWKAM